MSSQKILIISSVWVEPNSSAAGSRMLQLIEAFQSQHWDITYASTSLKNEFAFNLSSLQINTKTIELNNKSFDTFISNLKPTIVVFDRFIIEEQFGWRVAEKLPNCLRILDTEDLHCLRKTREIALKENRVFKETDLLKEDSAKREIASILRCDLSIIISKYEMKLLKNLFKIDESLLIHTPFLLDSVRESAFKKFPTYTNREHLYFIGNFLHQPNYDAVLFLKKEIWPVLSKKLPKIELHIYGAYPTQKVNQLHNKKERFIIKGRVEDLKEILPNYRICLAPIRFGAGLKGKFIEAMLFGTPSITTSIGSEAMHKSIEWSGFISNNSGSIINNTVTLYNNGTIWNSKQHQAIKIINKCYGKNKYSKKLIHQIVKTQKNLTKHRANNFMGELLQHHALQSTKYFSQWIEAKNKNLS